MQRQSGTDSLEDIWQFIINLNTVLPQNPEIKPLGIYPIALKAKVDTKLTREF